MRQSRTIDDILEIGQRLSIGVGDARTMVLLTEGNDILRRQLIIIDISGRSLRNIVVLTVQTAEVTTRTGDRETCGAGMKAIERFLLNGIDGQ